MVLWKDWEEPSCKEKQVTCFSRIMASYHPAQVPVASVTIRVKKMSSSLLVALSCKALLDVSVLLFG